MLPIKLAIALIPKLYVINENIKQNCIPDYNTNIDTLTQI